MIDILTNPQREQWHLFTADNPAAKYSHLLEWGEGLAATYSLPIFRLAAVNTATNRITGVLPLMLFAPPEQEVRLISLPYTDAAGMLTDELESSYKLLAAALHLADKLGANHLELRQDGTLHTFFAGYQAGETWSYTSHDFKTGLRRPVPPSVAALWSALSPKVRNQVRKARRCGAVAKTGGRELLPDFYAVFSENMRDLGSPVHDLNLFKNLLEKESLQAAVIVIYLLEKPAAASCVFLHNETVFNPWASSLRSYRPSCPNMLLYWSMLEYAVEHRCRWFDFGRSTPNAPTYRFKVQWGAERELLSWHVFSRKPHSWSPANESLAYDRWKKMELMRSRREGPAMRRWISL